MNTRPDWSVNGTGVGVYPVGAMLNHSCTPNVMQSFAGRRIIFRAIAPIAAGQEATISYVELSATRAERRATLLAGYCFDIDAGRVCECSVMACSLPLATESPTGTGNTIFLVFTALNSTWILHTAAAVACLMALHHESGPPSVPLMCSVVQ